MNRGFTLVELIVSITITLVLTTAAVVYFDPATKRAEARDNHRISDLFTIDRIINEYLIDTGAYPDTVSVLRDSTTLPVGSTELANVNTGWIASDLSGYASNLPLDPLNDSTYKYSYIHTTTTYELNAVLEELITYAQDDGGDDLSVYEVGNDLTLISP